MVNHTKGSTHYKVLELVFEVPGTRTSIPTVFVCSKYIIYIFCTHEGSEIRGHPLIHIRKIYV